MRGPSYWIDQVQKAAPVLQFDDNSRFVIMSDCHRGDQGWADSFAKNQTVFFAALSHYLEQEYTYIEAGDGDELWENRNFERIRESHSHVFWLMEQFYRKGRLYCLYGNHDIVKRESKFFLEHETIPWRTQEGIILKHQRKGYQILVTHGHQVDFINHSLWRLARILVRYLWRPLETLGVNDPTSTPENTRRREQVGERLESWAANQNRMLIAGHNHRPAFAEPGKPAYFNDGSCVHPRCITAIEIAGGTISLVKWSVRTKPDGTLFIGREVLAGPRFLADYFLNSTPDSNRIGEKNRE